MQVMTGLRRYVLRTMKEIEYRFSDITDNVIGGAMAVHTALGNGFPEVVYQRSLTIEMRDRGLAFGREVEIPLHYKGEEVGSRRADFLVEGKVLVELKAVSILEDVHVAQVLNYLTAYQLEVALLLNFGARKLEYRRLVKQQKDKSLKTA